MIVLYAAAGVLLMGLLGTGLARLARRRAAAKGTSDDSGSLMARDADRISVRSADNVRLLSDDQLEALEKSLDEER